MPTKCLERDFRGARWRVCVSLPTAGGLLTAPKEHA
jgi:hypothetical protein